MFKSHVSSILAEAAALRINLNLDGAKFIRPLIYWLYWQIPH